MVTGWRTLECVCRCVIVGAWAQVNCAAREALWRLGHAPLFAPAILKQLATGELPDDRVQAADAIGEELSPPPHPSSTLRWYGEKRAHAQRDLIGGGAAIWATPGFRLAHLYDCVRGCVGCVPGSISDVHGVALDGTETVRKN